MDNDGQLFHGSINYSYEHRSFQMSWTLILLLIQVTVCNSYRWISSLPTFVEQESLDFYRGVVDPNRGDLVVAGRNVIYRLTSDLKIVEKSRTGPELDHVDCLLNYPCDARLKKKVDNDNQVLLLIEDDKLLVCGTLYHGVCQIRYLSKSIEEYRWMSPFNDSLGFLSIKPSMYSKSLVDNSFERPVLWSALHDDPEARRPFSPPFLSRKVWKEVYNGSDYENTFERTVDSDIRFEGNATRYVIEGFKYANHIYFLIVHKYQDGTPTTRLARVCAEDLTFRTYSELVAACELAPTYGAYELATSAWCGTPTQWMKTQFHLKEGEKMLVISLAKDKLGGNAVCGFRMSEVEDAFENGQRKCLAEEEPVRGMDCHADLDYLAYNCSGNIDHPYLVERKLVSKNILAHFHVKFTIASFAIFEQNGVSVLIGATNESNVIKANLELRSVYAYNTLLAEKVKNSVPTQLIFDKEQKNIYFIVKDKVVKYPLESCGPHWSCPRCLKNGKTDPLSCAWCDGKCIFIQDCHNSTSINLDTCPPTITKVSYIDSLTKPGIIITLSGYGFGSYIDSKHNNVSVSDLTCEVDTWNDTQVACSFYSIPRTNSVAVRLSTINLNQTIPNPVLIASSILNLTHYRVPELYAIFPSKGPMSGGTHVIIYGDNLDVGNHRVINVRGRNCEDLAINSNAAWCVTEKTTNSELSDSISFIVDSQTFEMKAVIPESFNMTGRYQDFKYLPDPEIHQIYHGVTTVSGLMNVSVIGRYLNSVETPEMVVRITLTQSENELEFKEPCWSAPQSEGHTLTCRTPSLKNQPGIPLPTRTFPLVTHVTFLMDGVEEVRNLHRTKEAMSRLMYYPDPEVSHFRQLKKVWDNETLLEIQGHYLDLIHNPDNFYIKIGGHEICNIIKLQANSLQCELPSNLLHDSSLLGTNFSVVVTVGFSTQHLGFITIVERESETSVWKLMVVVIASCLLVCFIVFCCWKRRKGAKPFEDLTLSTPNRDGNDYSREMSRRIPSTRISNRTSEVGPPSEEDTLITPLIDQETLQVLQQEGLLIETQLLILGKEIGSGQFGCVYEGLLRSVDDCTRQKVAIKTLRNITHLEAAEKVSLFMQEALCMKDFKHPNVLSLIGVGIDKGLPLVVLPYMEHGDLHKYLRDTSKIIPDWRLLQFAVDVATGMAYLASSKFVHRDLAARNCVLDSQLSVRVADFGLSRDIYEKAYYTSQNKKAAVPCKWMAPDALEKGVYSEYTDVWSYGILLWELITRGMTPYPNVIGYGNVLQYVKEGHRLPQPDNCPDGVYALMRECWNETPHERPPFEEIKNRVRHIADSYEKDNEKPDIDSDAHNSTYLSMS